MFWRARRAAAWPLPVRIASTTSAWWCRDSSIRARLFGAWAILSEIRLRTTPRTTSLQVWISELRLIRAISSWKARSAWLNASKSTSITARIATSVSSSSSSSSGVRNRDATWIAAPSMIIRNPISSLRVSSSTRARRTICLRSADCENGRISGPCGSPGRDRTTPLLSSTRSASRTVDRLTANCATSSRSLGSRWPGTRSPLASASSTCSTIRSYARTGCTGWNCGPVVTRRTPYSLDRHLSRDKSSGPVIPSPLVRPVAGQTGSVTASEGVGVKSSFRIRAVAFLASAAVLALTACSAGSSTSGGGSGSSPGGDQKLSVGLVAEPASLDFTTTDGAAIPQALLGNVYETLVKQDDSGKIVPSLAKSWTVSPDRKTYTFDLVDNAKFTNGKQFTASDAVFSINRVKT